MQRSATLCLLGVLLTAACASEGGGDDELSAEDAVTDAQPGASFPALVSEKDIPVDVVQALKVRARTSDIRLAAHQTKGTLSAAAITRGDMLLVGIVAEQNGKQSVKDLRVFTRGPTGINLVKHAAVASALAKSGKGGASVLSASARTVVTGTENLKAADMERATSVAALTTYMAIASGGGGNTQDKRFPASRPIMMEQDNRCSGLDPLGQWSLYIPQRLDFDVLSCCQAHDVALACNCDKSVGATLGDNLKFISCVDRKANDAFQKLPWYTQLATGVLFLIERALLIDVIGTVVVSIGSEGTKSRGNLCGKDSCLCGGSKATVGPDPLRCKRGVNPHDCTYADYEYKMLCRGRPDACGASGRPAIPTTSESIRTTVGAATAAVVGETER